MQINITGHRLDVTPALRAFTEEKLNKLENHFDRIISINVVFDVEKLRQIAVATIFIANGEIHATSESEDMYAAVDLLVDKLNSQLMKHKGKMISHRDHREHGDYGKMGEFHEEQE